VATKDRTIHPDLECFVTEIDSSHVPMLSNPGVVLNVIREAASAVTGSQNGV
jgi:hypothetical protein